MADPLKLVLVGDSTVGKTCLLSVYTSGTFPRDYVPTIVNDVSLAVSVDNSPVRLHLCDTAGQEDYDRLRPISYPGTAVFLLCFSVDSRNSYKNVQDKWVSELKHYCPRTPIVLVATKADLRRDPSTIERFKKQGAAMVSSEEGQALTRSIGASKYVECSALLNQGLDTVFQEAVRVCLTAKGTGKKSKNGRGCRFL